VSLPDLVIHADWGTAPRKRWAAQARLRHGTYVVSAPKIAANPIATALRESKPALVGFDFPIGIPHAFGVRVGAPSFVELLPELGSGEWREFFMPASTPEEISPHRPFYPRRPGRTKHRHLLDALGFRSMDELRRVCERRHEARNAAEVLFWTLGPRQVGRAAIAGWRDILIPSLREIRLWPFQGSLGDFVDAPVVVCETYPSEFYAHLGLPRGKTSAMRCAAAQALMLAARQLDIDIGAELSSEICRGFANDDAYDAFVGLLGMLNVVLGTRAEAGPLDDNVRQVEGWMLGQTASG
jgi:hypothetical protein